LASRAFRTEAAAAQAWVHIAVVHHRWYLSLALVDLGFLGTSWLHLFNRRTGQAFEHSRKLPPGRFHAPDNVWDHSGQIKTRGYRVSAHNHLDKQVHRFEINSRRRPTASSERQSDAARGSRPDAAAGGDLPLGPTAHVLAEVRLPVGERSK